MAPSLPNSMYSHPRCRLAPTRRGATLLPHYSYRYSSSFFSFSLSHSNTTTQHGPASTV